MNFARITQQDAPEVEAFLRARAEYVMFPLSNLMRFGVDGDDPRAPRMWRNADGPLSDVLTITKAGMVMPYLPSGSHQHAAQVLSGREIIGLIGATTETRNLQNALGLAQAEMTLDPDEQHFLLNLADLRIPDGDSNIVAASETTRGVLTEWMIDYHINTIGQTADDAAQAVPDRITHEIANGSRVVLMQGDTPVATTAFNAQLPEIVQIGGVYTPPQHRGNGHARRALALHLDHARKGSVTKATLAANAPSAIAAYMSVGFEQIGRSVLMILKTPQVAP